MHDMSTETKDGYSDYYEKIYGCVFSKVKIVKGVVEWKREKNLVTVVMESSYGVTMAVTYDLVEHSLILLKTISEGRRVIYIGGEGSAKEYEIPSLEPPKKSEESEESPSPKPSKKSEESEESPPPKKSEESGESGESPPPKKSEESGESTSSKPPKKATKKSKKTKKAKKED